MERLERIRKEFSQQADRFDRYAPSADENAAKRFALALDDTRFGRVLDVACGPGVVTAALAPKSQEVTALDATDAMLEKARERCRSLGIENVVFLRGDAEALPFENASFDAVVTRLSIHHFEHPDRMLVESYRVLKPGGRLALADIVVSEEAEGAEAQNAVEVLRDPSHVRMLPASELDALIERAGFTIVDAESWDKERELEEWIGIANDAKRCGPLRVIARVLAETGRSGAMALRLADDGSIRFTHRWRMIAAEK